MIILVARFAPSLICPNQIHDVGTKLDLHILSVALQSFYINIKILDGDILTVLYEVLSMST